MLSSIKRFFGRPKDPSGNVYYARLRTLHGTFYKIGYTSKPTLTERMAFGGRGDEQLIDKEFFFSFREDAWDVEQDLLDHFDRYRAFGKFSKDPAMPLSGSGQSELFRFDVLGLDDDLYTKPDEETLKAVRTELENDRDGCLLMLVGLVLAPFTLGLSLLLIVGGGSQFFGKKRETPRLGPQRPDHPPAIRRLTQELISNCKLASERREHATSLAGLSQELRA